MARANASKLLCLLFSVLFFAGCSAIKETGTVVSVYEAEPAALSCLPSMNRNIEYLSADVKMEATINGETAKARGKFRLKRDEGVQISATAMGLMEAACFEFLPQNVRFIYKIDKIYADTPYGDVPFFHYGGVNYRVLQSLLCNALFSPDGTPMDKSLEGAVIEECGEHIEVKVPGNGSSCRFLIEKRNGRLVRSEGYDGEASYSCMYGDFTSYDGTEFPLTAELKFNGGGTTASLLLEMNDIKGKEFKFAPRRISSSYSRATLQWIVNSVGENTGR